jgi:hypothetical protein
MQTSAYGRIKPSRTSSSHSRLGCEDVFDTQSYEGGVKPFEFCCSTSECGFTGDRRLQKEDIPMRPGLRGALDDTIQFTQTFEFCFPGKSSKQGQKRHQGLRIGRVDQHVRADVKRQHHDEALHAAVKTRGCIDDTRDQFRTLSVLGLSQGCDLPRKFVPAISAVGGHPIH